MKRFLLNRRLVRSALPVIALTSVLGTIPDARAIHCVESLLPVGNPSLIPVIEEIDPREVDGIKERMTMVLSKEPRVTAMPEGDVAIMSGDAPGDLQVIGVEGRKPFYRPNVHEVKGFVRYAAAEGSPPISRVTPNRMYNPKSKLFLYGKPGGTMRQVFMETNETIAAHAVIDPNRQLVVTVRTDQKIGLRRQGEDAKRNFMIEVYQLESEGHAVISFRIDADEVPYPKIQISTDAERKKFLLQVEENHFVLELLSPSAFGG